MRPTTLIFIVLSVLSQVCHADDDPSNSCIGNLEKEPRFASMAKKVPFRDIADMTFQMLADESLPTQAERKIIAEYIDGRMLCTRLGEGYRQKNYTPQLRAILAEGENNLIALATELYNRRLPYGKFNARLKATYDDTRSKVAVLAQQMRSQSEAQQEELRRSAKLQAEQAQKSDLQRAQEARIAQAQKEQQEAAQQQLVAQCKLLYNQTLMQQGQRPNDCYAGSGNAMMTMSCTILQVEAAKAYAQNQYETCISALAR